MTDSPGSTTATPELVPPQAPPVAARSGVWWPLAIALLGLVAVAALVASVLLWQRLSSSEQEMARRHQETMGKALEARTLADQSGALVDAIQARLSVAEVRLSEVSLQRSQLEELMLSVSRSRDDNLVQDLESAIRLAQQQSQLTGSVQPLLTALQSADQRIARAAQPRLNPVQRAIARDIERLQGAAVVDIPSQLGRLDDLVRQVDIWRVRNQIGLLPPQADGASGKAADALPADPPATAQPDTASKAAERTTGAADADPGEDIPGSSGWSRVRDSWQGFWQRVWVEVTREGRELVRVSRIDEPDAMLLAPEQAFLLRENIKLKLLNARLALLARQTSSLQGDLKAVDAALQRYFDPAQSEVSAALTVVSDLRQQLVSLELPRPDETLAALLVAAGGR